MVWVKRATLGVAALVVVALIVTAISGVIMARRSFPTTSGEVDVAGLSRQVQVVRDRHGVPTIIASSSEDLFRAQGYVHAQDRFWEMDMRRHVTAGRVSELFGVDQVPTDRFTRTLGWRLTAEAELELLDDDAMTMLEAYADGVNVWMEGRTGSRLSFEHGLLPVAGARRYEPEPWVPADSVAWLKAMAWDLRSNLDDELLRARLSALDLSEGRSWQDLYPDFPADRHPVILPNGGSIRDGRFAPAAGTTDVAEVEAASDSGPHHLDDAGIEAALAAARAALEVAPVAIGDGTADGIGSNSWVIGPDRSTTGTALLANDPHLGPSQPSLWYQVGLQCQPVGPNCPYDVLGFSFSGLPGIVIGHNARVAWGFTNLGADVADLVVERLDGDRYLTEDGWEPLEIREETIRVAGGQDVPVTIRATRHGPLFSDISDDAAELAQDPSVADLADTEHAVALQWVASQPAGTMDALPAFMRARDWESFREAASAFHVPSQNLIYADVDGNIGYQAPGLIPVRRSGDGTLPTAGWTQDAGWERFLDFEELPWTLNPSEGYLATANQPVLPSDTEPFLSADFSMGHRADRIVDLIAAQDRVSPEDLGRMQRDTYNANGAALAPVLSDIDDRGDPGVAQVQAVLDAWDHRDDADSAGAAAFNVTWRHLLERTFNDELPDWAWPSGSGRWWEVVRGLVEEPDSVWWDDVTAAGTQTRDDILHAAMTAAHAELLDTFSDDPDDWRWGELHVLHLTHGTFGASGIGPVERLFNRGPLETSGGSDVLNATGWTAHRGYEVNWVPSMRMVLDLGDLDAGRWIHLTGQSGRPFHPHYTDQADAWRDGGLLPMTFSEEAARATAVDHLMLVPVR